MSFLHAELNLVAFNIKTISIAASSDRDAKYGLQRLLLDTV